MTAKTVSIGDSLTGGVVRLQKKLEVFEEIYRWPLCYSDYGIFQSFEKMLRKCFEEFIRFNIVDVQLSTENMLHDAMCHINTTVAPDIPRTYMQLSLPLKTALDPLSILHYSFNHGKLLVPPKGHQLY